jgi:hypothetical protein
MQTDFDDIRFTDDDGVTLLDYWLEVKIDSTSAVFWVEVKDYIQGNDFQPFYMYYGNDTVSTTSNGPHTFPFFDDFNDDSINTTLWYNWFTDGTSIESGGILSVEGGDEGTETQGGKVQFGTAYAYEYYVSFGNDDQDYEMIGFDDRSFDGDYEGSGVDSLEIAGKAAAIHYTTKDDSSVTDIVRTTDYTSWIRLSARRAVANILIYENDALEETLVVDIPQDDCGVWIYARNSNSVVNLDFVFVRKYVLGVGIHSWGDEEKYDTHWNIAGTAVLIFSVPIDETGLDMLLIFLGLIMIPASTLYIVKGGRSEMSSDKLFYFLIAFIIGWALVIGGIYA